MEITGKQIRGARGLVGISMEDLAKEADISLAALQRLETSYVTSSRDSTLEAVVGALKKRGVRFIQGGVKIETSGISQRASVLQKKFKETGLTKAEQKEVFDLLERALNGETEAPMYSADRV